MQILRIFSCNKCILVRLWVKVFVSQEWVQAEITVAIKFRVNLINFRTLSLTLLALPISIGTNQVKQQKYSEKRYPIKSFTVPSKTYNKVLIQQYYIVATPSPFTIKIATLLVVCIATPNDDFKESPISLLINMKNVTRHHTYFSLTNSSTKQTSRQSSLIQVEITPSPLL